MLVLPGDAGGAEVTIENAPESGRHIEERRVDREPLRYTFC